MTETTVDANLLEMLEILTELVVEVVGKELRVGAVLEILLTIQEPGGNLVGGWVLHDGDDALHLLGLEFAGTLAHVDLGFAAHDAGEATTTPLDGSEGKLNFKTTIYICVEQTQDVLEALALGYIYRLRIMLAKTMVGGKWDRIRKCEAFELDTFVEIFIPAVKL